MPKLVRVKLPTGREVTVGESFAKSHDLKVLDKPAVNTAGKALPTKPKTSVAQAAESKRANPTGSNKPASSKEESK